MVDTTPNRKMSGCLEEGTGFELYQQETTTVLVKTFTDGELRAYHIDPVTAMVQEIVVCQDRTTLLGQCKKYFSIDYAFVPRQRFDCLIGYVPAAQQSWLVVCDRDLRFVTLNRPIYRPANVRFIQCRMLQITQQLTKFPAVNAEAWGPNAMLGPIRPGSTHPLDTVDDDNPECVLADLISALQQFFDENSQYMYFSDGLNLTELTEPVTSPRNHFLVNDILTSALSGVIRPIQPILGDVTQIQFDAGNYLYKQTIVTRQNLLHVGTRFNARGLNSLAGAANEFEHQIIYEFDTADCKAEKTHHRAQTPLRTGFFCCYTILRGSVPVHWKTEASLLRNDFVLSQRPYELASLYWHRIFQRYRGCCILNLLKSPGKHKPGQPYISSTEQIICSAYEISINNLSTSFHFCYNNYQWHDETAQIKQQVRQWFRNDGNIQNQHNASFNVKNIGLETLNTPHFDIQSKNNVSQLRQELDYVTQMLNLANLLLQLKYDSFDMTFGCFDTRVSGPGTPCDIVVHYHQQNILRVNCADSLDRTNIAVFHIQQVLNAINIRFLEESQQQIIQYVSQGGDGRGRETPLSSTLHSLGYRKSAASGDGYNVYEQHVAFQRSVLQQFQLERGCRPSPGGRVYYLTFLENLLFTGTQGKAYARLARAFYDIANVLSQMYTGVDAAHQEVLSLFSDIEVASSSMVALRRRIVSASGRDRARHSSKNAVQRESLVRYLAVLPFGPDLGPARRAAPAGGSAPASPAPAADGPPAPECGVEACYLRYAYTQGAGAAPAAAPADRRVGRGLARELALDAGAARLQYYVQGRLLAGPPRGPGGLAGAVGRVRRMERQMAARSRDARRLLPGPAGGRFPAAGAAEFDELQLCSAARRENLLRYARLAAGAGAERERLEESLKVQVTTDYCPLRLAGSAQLTRDYVDYVIEEKMGVRRAEAVAAIRRVVQGHGRGARGRRCFSIRYRFGALVSLTDVVAVVPPRRLGACCRRLLVFATDDGGCCFLLRGITFPAQMPHEQQVHFSLEQYEVDSNNLNYQLVHSISRLFDGRNAVNCISSYPRVTELELLFVYEEASAHVLPKIFLVGKKRHTKLSAKWRDDPDERNNSYQQFHQTILTFYDQTILERLNRVRQIVNQYDIIQNYHKTFELLLFAGHSKNPLHKDEFNLTDFMYSTVFGQDYQQLQDALRGSDMGFVSSQLIIYCYAKRLNIPTYYLHSVLQLLDLPKQYINSVINPQIGGQSYFMQNIQKQRQRVVKANQLALQNIYDIEYNDTQLQSTYEEELFLNVCDVVQEKNRQLSGDTQAPRQDYKLEQQGQAKCSGCHNSLCGRVYCECYRCQKPFCPGCLHEKAIINVHCLDLNTQIIICKDCYSICSHLIGVISRYIQLSIENHSGVVNYDFMKENYCKINHKNQVITLSQLQEVRSITLHLSNRINLVSTTGNCFTVTVADSNKYSTRYEIQLSPPGKAQCGPSDARMLVSEIELEYSGTNITRKKLQDNEISVQYSYQYRHNLPYVNLAAFNAYVGDDDRVYDVEKRAAQPHDCQISVQEGKYGTKCQAKVFQMVFAQNVQISQIRMLNLPTKPRYVVISYLKMHDDDVYIRQRKKPSKLIRARQNGDCVVLAEEEVVMCDHFLGGKYIAYELENSHQYQSNRICIQLVYEGSIPAGGDKDNNIGLEVFTPLQQKDE